MSHIQRVLLVFVFLGLGVLLLYRIMIPSSVQELHVVLVDLEYGNPDNERHKELRQVIANLPNEFSELAGTKIFFSQVHFSLFTESFITESRPDLIILSPQGTPWSRYGSQIEPTQNLVKQLVKNGRIPLLGICGGHQFLAMTMGSKVDHIDPELQGRKVDHYPRGALSEKGPTVLQVTGSDPIFRGAVENGTLVVIENHYEEVKDVPNGFVNIAESRLSPVQLIAVPGKVIYGMAFHPERVRDGSGITGETHSAGWQLLANVLLMSAEQKRSARNE